MREGKTKRRASGKEKRKGEITLERDFALRNEVVIEARGTFDAENRTKKKKRARGKKKKSLAESGSRPPNLFPTWIRAEGGRKKKKKKKGGKRVGVCRSRVGAGPACYATKKKWRKKERIDRKEKKKKGKTLGFAPPHSCLVILRCDMAMKGGNRNP